MIIIIGAGAHGLSIAYHLMLKEKDDVIIIEANRINYGSSSRNIGRFRYSFINDYNIQFAKKAIPYLEQVSNKIPLNPFFSKTGYLWLLNTSESLEQFKKLHQKWKEYNVEGYFIDKCNEEFNYLNYNEECYFNPNNGSLHHDYFVYGLYEVIKEKYKIIFDEVTKIIVNNGKVKGVQLRSGKTIEANNVVVAAGAWSPIIMRSLGIDLPIIPLKVTAFVTEPLKYMIKPLIIDSKTGVYYSQTLKGEIIGGLEENLEGLQPFTSSFNIIYKVIKRAKELTKGIAGIGILRSWSGYYEMTPDHSHIMGYSNEWPEGLYVDAGYSGHGFMFSAYAGKLMADLIVDNIMDPFISIYSPDRFKDETKWVKEYLVI